MTKLDGSVSTAMEWLSYEKAFMDASRVSYAPQACADGMGEPHENGA